MLWLALKLLIFADDSVQPRLPPPSAAMGWSFALVVHWFDLLLLHIPRIVFLCVFLTLSLKEYHTEGFLASAYKIPPFHEPLNFLSPFY